jgi:hypothetical protein
VSAIVESTGVVRRLDTRAGEQINVTADDVRDAPKLARLLQGAVRELAAQRRRWAPRELYFRGQTVDATGTTKYRLTHNFGGLVNYAPVYADDYPQLKVHADTDENTLVLVSGTACTVTIRVWEAG